VLQPHALATSVRGSLRQGPLKTEQVFLLCSCFHFWLCAHARRTNGPFGPGCAGFAVDPPCALRRGVVVDRGSTERQEKQCHFVCMTR
jgi:hypothetical protein